MFLFEVTVFFIRIVCSARKTHVKDAGTNDTYISDICGSAGKPSKFAI